MAVTDARAAQAIVKRYAVFIKIAYAGGGTNPQHFQFVRRPYDIVSYDWQNGEVYTYLQPRGRGNSPTLDDEVYDGVRFYDPPPSWDWKAPSGSAR
jgi:hypothetical protein